VLKKYVNGGDSLTTSTGYLPGLEVGFAEIAIDFLQARFWITSGLPTIHPALS
jgi:hypothetical protein